MPSDANGVPFNAACIDAGGNLIANMRANVAAEAIGRTLACRLLEMTDDPGMKDMAAPRHRVTLVWRRSPDPTDGAGDEGGGESAAVPPVGSRLRRGGNR